MKINKGQLNKKESVVKTPEQIHHGLVRFSFKYLAVGHQKFSLPNTAEKQQYLETLFDRLQKISTMLCHDFRQAGKALRSHVIDWEKTSEPEGFSHLTEQLQGCMAWQFSLAREELGRVHGFWIGDVFYPVWIDHEHQLYA
jgi:hypothetical protein